MLDTGSFRDCIRRDSKTWSREKENENQRAAGSNRSDGPQLNSYTTVQGKLTFQRKLSLH